MTQEPEIELTVEDRLAACSETARVLFAMIEKHTKPFEYRVASEKDWAQFGFQELADRDLIVEHEDGPHGGRAWHRRPIVQALKVVRS